MCFPAQYRSRGKVLLLSFATALNVLNNCVFVWCLFTGCLYPAGLVAGLLVRVLFLLCSVQLVANINLMCIFRSNEQVLTNSNLTVSIKNGINVTFSNPDGNLTFYLGVYSGKIPTHRVAQICKTLR